MADEKRIDEILEAYVARPTPASLQELQVAILRDPGFDPLVALDAQLADLDRAGDAQGVVDAIWRQMPGLLLSPLAHARLAAAYAELGDETQAQRERSLARLAIAGIRGSGDGDEEQPFRVLRIQDEYDILGAAGLSPREQEERSDAQAVYDVHTTGEGRRVWFELLWRAPAAG